MGSIITSFALPKTKVTYNRDLPYLTFVKASYGNIPVVHYHRDDYLPTLLMAHSNGEDIGQFNVKKLSHQFNANIVVFDYCGYGLNTCKEASEDHCYHDIEHVYIYLIRCGILAENIILYGRSIGTGVASHMARLLCKHKIPTKLILVSPFKSVIRVMINLPYCPGDLFNIEKMAPNITCPVLIIHGCQDKLTDYRQSVALSALFPCLTQFVTIHGCGHHELTKREEYIDAIHSFVTD